jgi:hypothetical protein
MKELKPYRKHLVERLFHISSNIPYTKALAPSMALVVVPLLYKSKEELFWGNESKFTMSTKEKIVFSIIPKKKGISKPQKKACQM